MCWRGSTGWISGRRALRHNSFSTGERLTNKTVPDSFRNANLKEVCTALRSMPSEGTFGEPPCQPELRPGLRLQSF